jgi:nucleoside-triphosphatase
MDGFLTTEVRSGDGARVGFEVVSLCGANRASLASSLLPSSDGPRVGKYTVTVQSFEEFALPILERILVYDEPMICIIDEIGKMELLSSGFVTAMRQLLSSPSHLLLCTIARKGGGFIAEAKQKYGMELIEIDQENRDSAVKAVVDKLILSANSSSGCMRTAPAQELMAHMRTSPAIAAGAKSGRSQEQLRR